MSSAEPTLRGALLRLGLVAAVFVGGVVFFVPTPRGDAVTSSGSASLSSSIPWAEGCDLQRGPCRVALDAHHGVELSWSKRPVASAMPFEVVAHFDGAATNPRVTFVGDKMTMPVTTLSLAPRGQGTFVGRGQLPLCTDAKMSWTARVDVDLDGEPHAAGFAFVTTNVASARDGGVASEDVETFPIAPAVDATLVSGTRTLTLSSFLGQAVLVGFGFTSCPDICPTTLSSWAAAFAALAPTERQRVAGLFISVDPERDSPTHVQRYASFFDARIVGATGSRAQIDAATSVFGAPYVIRREAGPDAGGDTAVDHAASSWIVAPDGHIAAKIPFGATPDVITRALQRTLSERTP
jgi:protein SCO1/2